MLLLSLNPRASSSSGLVQLRPRSLRAILSLAAAMSSAPAQRAFQLRLDPLSGNSEWVVIDEDEDEDEEKGQLFAKQPLLATTSYLDMLNDSPRNRAFRQAIDKTVTAPCHALDIGGGTGLLAMMAARAMGCGGDGKSGVVTSCESYLPMVKLMKKVLRLNAMQKRVNVINKRSDELSVGSDIPSRAHVLVSEILDSELLGEGLIPTLQHAHDTLLVENPETVPYRATTYGQLVESTFLLRLHDLCGNETRASDGIHLVPAGLENIVGVKSQQYAFQCNALEKEIKLLSEPFKIFEFDFWKRPDSHGDTQLCVKATNDGQVHAVISWWVLQLDREGSIFYSTAPRWITLPTNKSDKEWCDHWKQCVWFVLGRGLTISKDEEVHVHAVHDETSISYNLKAHSQSEDMMHGFKGRDFQLLLSPERIGIYGDSEWRSFMLKAIRNALKGRVDPLCMVADDSVFLTLLVAHLSRTSKIVSLFPGLRGKGLQYLQAVADANGFSMDRVQVLKSSEAFLSLQNMHPKKVDLLIGEPFYCGTDAALPWQNLRFWKERTMLSSVLSEDAVILPCKGILKACAMSLPDLWKSRRCLDQIEGFDHSAVNTTLGACGALPAPQEGPCLPYFIWQCGEYKPLSEAFTVMEFDCSRPISPSYGKTQVEFDEPGTCHGFALWIDWVMDSENTMVLSTGPDKRYWKQGVKLLAQPVEVGTLGSTNPSKCYRALIEASFDPSNGELVIGHVFSNKKDNISAVKNASAPIRVSASSFLEMLVPKTIDFRANGFAKLDSHVTKTTEPCKGHDSWRFTRLFHLVACHGLMVIYP